jgi:hypothetical protein
MKIQNSVAARSLSALLVLLIALTACSQKRTSLMNDSGTVRTLICSASTPLSSLNIPTTASGAPIGSVNFSILVNSNFDATLSEVRLNGVPLSDIQPLPAGLARSHVVVVPVSVVGTSLVEVATISEGSVAGCSIPVTTIAEQVAGPMVTTFTANPVNVEVGATTDLTAQVGGGEVTSLHIANTLVPINSGVGTLRVTMSQTGSTVFRAVATGPGGLHERSVTVFTRPTCTIRASASTGYVGSPLSFDVTIAGGYTSGQVSANGLQVAGIPTGQTSFRTSAMVTSATGVQPVSLDLIAPGGLTSRCQDTVTLVAPTGPPPAAPTCTLEAPSGTSRIEGNSIYLFFTINGTYASGRIAANGLNDVNFGPGLNHGATWPMVLQATGAQTAVLTLTYGGGLTATCTVALNLLPNTNPPTVNFTINGSDDSGRIFNPNQVVRFAWSSAGAESCEFLQTGLNLPNTLSGTQDIVIQNSQTVRFKCIRSTPNGNVWAYKDVGWGITAR